MQYRVLNPSLQLYGPVLKPGTPMSAGIDLRAMIDAPIGVRPGEMATFPTGLAVYLGTDSLAGLVLPRSGLGSAGLVLANLVGLIDGDYQGEITCRMRNIGPEWIPVGPGDRIAQLMFIPVATASVIGQLQQVGSFDVESERGEGGFGSTKRQ